MNRMFILCCVFTVILLCTVVYAQNIELIASLDLQSGVDDISISGNYAYVSNTIGEIGIYVIDISNIEEPFVAGFLQTEYSPENVASNTSHLFQTYNVFGPEYVINGYVNIFDLADPINPLFISSWGNIFGFFTDIFALRDSVYISEVYFAAIYIVDISDPSLPIHAGSFLCPEARAVFANENYVFGCCRSYFYIFDPITHNLVGSLGGFGDISCVTVAGDLAFVGWGNGLSVIDISSPANPQLLSSFIEVGRVFEVRTVDSYIFVADGDIAVFEYSHPDSLNMLDYFVTPGYTSKFELENEYILAADRYALLILRFNSLTNTLEDISDIPSRYSLSQNYPNPLNASTTIEYSLPEVAEVTIEIYDILGRKVQTRLNTKQPAGFHHIIWDATHFPSGIYFYRIQAGDYTDTRKMLLLR